MMMMMSEFWFVMCKPVNSTPGSVDLKETKEMKEMGDLADWKGPARSPEVHT